MSIQIIGANSGTAGDVDSDRNILSIRRPAGYVIGSYSMAVPTGSIVSAASNAVLFSMWWTDPSKLALIESVECSTYCNATITTAVKWALGLYRCHKQALADSGGTSLADINVNSSTGLANQTRRTGMPQSAVTDMRIATTAGLTNTNVTGRDTQAVGKTMTGNTGTVTGTQAFTPTQQYLWHCKFMQGAFPLVLEPFTKLQINADGTASNTTGSIVVVLRINWSEIQLTPPQF